MADDTTERDRYRRLPAPIRLEDTVATQDAEPVPDPEGGQDTETRFMLRYAG
ncbi:hypothetical protein BH10ACT10_BH10ACT10_17730 [soil metagenome]